MVNIRRLILYLLILLMPQFSFAQKSDEYSIKAIYLEKIIELTDWPAALAMDDTLKAFVACVIGDSPINKKLDKVYSSAKILNKRVELRYVEQPEDIPDCHVLFIAGSEKEHLSKILNVTRNKPILTISDTAGFGTKGVLLNFYLDNENVRFEINEKAALESGLNFNYRLKKVARIIHHVGVEN